MQTECLEHHIPVNDTEKTLVTEVRGRLGTMLSAIEAPLSTANGLLVASRKYAAISTCVETRRPGVKQLLEFLYPLKATMGVCHLIIR